MPDRKRTLRERSLLRERGLARWDNEGGAGPDGPQEVRIPSDEFNEATMTQRIDYRKASPGAFQAMLAMEAYARKSGLEHSLLELVKTRVSQINGCAYCLDMHTKDARAAGETEQRLYLLPAWRETTFYSQRERAALAWAEVVTQLPGHEVPDDIYAQAREQFDESELVDLTLAIIAINGWNRLAIPFRSEAGSYQPAAPHSG